MGMQGEVWRIVVVLLWVSFIQIEYAEPHNLFRIKKPINAESLDKEIKDVFVELLPESLPKNDLPGQVLVAQPLHCHSTYLLDNTIKIEIFGFKVRCEFMG